MNDAIETSRGSAKRNWPTTTKPLGREEIQRRQREKILRATIDLVSERGYNQTSAERICKVAGVSFPTFRKHFRDKEEAFLAAVDETFKEGHRRVVKAMDAVGEDWQARVAAGLDTVLELVREDPPRATLCLVETLSAGKTGIEMYEATVRLFISGLLPGREEAEGGAGLPPLLEETIAGGIAWSIHQRLAFGEADQVEDLYEALLETVLTPYVGESRARKFAEQQASAR